MGGGPLPIVSRLLIFLAFEGVIAWHLTAGLKRGRFAFFDTPDRIDRARNPIRYWGWVSFLLGAMLVVAWRAWESVGWDLVIVAACARDLNYCP